MFDFGAQISCRYLGLRLVGFAQHETAAPNRLDVVRAARSIAELPAQFTDEYVDYLHPWLVQATVKMIEEHLFRYGRAFTQGQKLQDGVFFSREVQVLSRNLDGLGVEIDDEVANRNDRLGMSLGPAHEGADARDQLVLVEGLRH